MTGSEEAGVEGRVNRTVLGGGEVVGGDLSAKKGFVEGVLGAGTYFRRWREGVADPP